MCFYFYWVQQFENVFQTATALYGYLEKKTNLIQFWVVIYIFTVTLLYSLVYVFILFQENQDKKAFTFFIRMDNTICNHLLVQQIVLY